MKKSAYSIVIEIKKTLFSYGFILCMIITALLCFTSEIYIDSVTGREYSVIEIMADKSKFLSYGFRSVDILHNSVSPYLTIFIPVLSSISFVTAFCAERISGNMRFVISRNGKYAYYISKFVSAAISGGMAVMLGFVLYSIIICISFSGENLFAAELLKMYAGMGIYGIISVIPAFFISSFIKNKYMICCFPFIFMHFYYTSISKIQDIFNSYNRYDITAKMSFLFPNELKEIFFNFNIWTIIYNAALLIAAFIGFAIIMNRRLDYGQ